jgi:hypothetical protein
VYLGDIFTKEGVPLLSPSKKIGLPRDEKKRLKTGGSKEMTILAFLSVLGAVEVLFLTGTLRFPKTNLPHLRMPSFSFSSFWSANIFYIMASLLLLGLAGFYYWYRWRWRYKFSRNSMTYQVFFSHQSEDLPLRSEQLGNLLHNLHLPRRYRIFTGQPHITVTFASQDEKRLYITVPDMWGFPDKVRDVISDKLRGSRLQRVEFSLPAAVNDRRYGRVKPLRNSPAYSLRTLKGFEQDDPLEVVFNSLDVGEGSAFIFLLLKPVGGSWKRSARSVREKIRTADDGNMDRAVKRSGFLGIISMIIRTFFAILVEIFNAFTLHASTSDAYLVATAMRPDAGEKDHRRELSEEVKEIVKSIDDKINTRASFRYEIRIMVEKEGVNFHDVDRIAATFRQYDKHQSLTHNRCHWPVDRVFGYLVMNNLWPVFGSKGIISSDELAGFLHNPYKTSTLVKMDMNTSRTEPAPPPLTQKNGDRVCLGMNHHRDGSELVTIPWGDFRLHGMCCGMTGCGKSTLLKHIILQWIDQGEQGKKWGCFFVEPHGDAVLELIRSLPPRHLDRVYFLDPGDTQHPICFNPLAYSGSMASSDHIRDTILASFKAYWEIDPSMASLLQYLPRVMDVLARVKGAHFGWVKPFITNDRFRNKILMDLKDQEAIAFWKHYEGKTKQHREDETRSLLSRVDSFIMDSRMRAIFSQAHTRIDFLKLMDEGNIVVAWFGDQNSGPVAKRLMGNLFCSYFHQAAQLRGNVRRPFLICLDEAREYITPNLAEILSQDRKWGLSLMLSFQYMAQMTELIDAVKGNITTRISFQMGEEDALSLAPLFSSSSDPDEVRKRADDLMNLQRYQAFLKTTVEGRPLPPTTFSISKPIDVIRWEYVEKVMAHTHSDLCRPGWQVEKEIEAFYDNLPIDELNIKDEINREEFQEVEEPVS